MSWALLSIVGLRPSATAVAVRTCLDHLGRPEKIALLCTEAVRKRNIHGRLCAFLKSRGVSEEQIEIIEIANQIDEGVDGDAPEAARTWFAQFDASVTRMFYADSGLKFLIGAVAMALPHDVHVGHADGRNLSLVRRKGSSVRYKLSNLGLVPLLGLYDVRPHMDGEVAEGLRPTLGYLQAPGRVVTGLTFPGVNVPRIDFAFERGGWLFGLAFVGNSPAEVRDRQRMGNALNGLFTVITICSPQSRQLTRARSFGMQGMQLFPKEPQRSAKSLQRWLDGSAKMPGHEVALQNWRQPKLPEDVSGKGSDGPPMFMWMAPDPSATLVSIYSHRPRELWLGVDVTTEAAVQATERLASLAGTLPCGPIHFVPSDLQGRHLPAHLPVEAVNISPGTAGQGLAAITLAIASSAPLWSLRQANADATRLDGAETVPLNGPAALVQLRIRRGDLMDDPPDAKQWDPNRVSKLISLASDLVASVQRGRPLFMFGWARANDLVIPKEPGKAFEQVVAACFVRVGADDVLVNLEWPWRGQGPGEKKFEGELDVLARFGHRFYVVSCKLGSTQLEHSALDHDATETEAKALTNVGRLAIPLLVRLAVDAGEVAKFKEQFPKTTVLTLADLIPTQRTRTRLDQIANSRSTTTA